MAGLLALPGAERGDLVAIAAGGDAAEPAAVTLGPIEEPQRAGRAVA